MILSKKKLQVGRGPVKVSALRPHPENPRVHPPAQIEALAGAYKEFGFRGQIVAHESGTIIAGQGRWEAAKLAGFEEIDADVVGGKEWTPEKILGLVLADNRYPELASYDQVKLRAAVASLHAVNYSLSAVGYDMKATENILAEIQPPSEFRTFGENIPTEHQCPSCGYRWSGFSGRVQAEKVPPEKTKKNGAHARK